MSDIRRFCTSDIRYVRHSKILYTFEDFVRLACTECVRASLSVNALSIALNNFGSRRCGIKNDLKTAPEYQPPVKKLNFPPCAASRAAPIGLSEDISRSRLKNIDRQTNI